ncbi:MAG: hypothetical protein ACO2OZ_00365 [Acidilobaceae archaeon]
MHVIDVLPDSFTGLFRHQRSLERLGIIYLHETFGERNSNKEVVQGIEEQDEEVPQQRQLKDSEKYRGDSNGGSNCA